MFDCMYWNPPAEEKHKWEHIDPVKSSNRNDSVRIYESHVGMAQEAGKVSSYREYAEHILPRVKKAGYNVIQLMAIQEHAYYGSFGYHVTGFFGISSRSGTPDDFKFLVDKAHGMGIKIVIDLVHSHASNNVFDGINRFDGTDHSFSHGGARGYHSGWDSMLFDYSKYEVKRFLLSNLAWFLLLDLFLAWNFFNRLLAQNRYRTWFFWAQFFCTFLALSWWGFRWSFWCDDL